MTAYLDWTGVFRAILFQDHRIVLCNYYHDMGDVSLVSRITPQMRRCTGSAVPCQRRALYMLQGLSAGLGLLRTLNVPCSSASPSLGR